MWLCLFLPRFSHFFVQVFRGVSVFVSLTLGFLHAVHWWISQDQPVAGQPVAEQQDAEQADADQQSEADGGEDFALQQDAGDDSEDETDTSSSDEIAEVIESDENAKCIFTAMRSEHSAVVNIPSLR